MRSVHRLSLLLALLSIAAASCARDSKVNSVVDMSEFVRDWQISRQFTLDVANAMPADLYSFKPNAEEMTFGEQMVHIAGSNVFRFNQITGIKPRFPFDLSKPMPSDKETALKLLEQSFDYVLAALPQITPEQLKRTWHIPSWKGRNDPDTPLIIARSAKCIFEPKALSRPITLSEGMISSFVSLVSFVVIEFRAAHVPG